MVLWLMVQLVTVLVQQFCFQQSMVMKKIVQSRAGSRKVSIYHCEVEGIVLGLSMIVDYFCKLDDRLNLEIVHLFSDSCSAINAVEKCTSTVRPDTYVGGQIFNNSPCVRRQHAPIIPDLGIKPEKKLTFLGLAYRPF